MTPAMLVSINASEGAAIGASYSLEDWHFATLSRISAHLAKYNCIISCTPDVLYTATYLADVAKFMAASLAAYESAPQTSSMYRWLHGATPVPYQPQIEITPRQAVDYIRKALSVCRSDESANLALELANLEKELAASEFGKAFQASH